MDDALRKFHIRTGVLDALRRHGIAHDSPLCAQLEANATIASGDNSRRHQLKERKFPGCRDTKPPPF